MKKFLFSTFMGVLVALVGCQQEDELTGVENTLGKKVSVTANIKANAQSRVAMEYVTGADGGSTIKVEWKEGGESFLMYDATDETKVSTFRQTSGNQFEGTLPSASSIYYSAEYGSIANLATQDGTLNEKYVWMSAQVFDLTQPIQFEHKTTVLKPTFTFESEPINSSISKIVMGGVTLPDDVEAITVEPESKEDIFIFLPAFIPFSENHTFNFTVTIGDKEYVAELSIGKSMEAGKFYTANIALEKVAEPIPYVTFTADAAQTLMYTGNDLKYSTDGVNFEPLTSTDEIEFGNGVKLYLCGDDNLDGTFKEIVINYPVGHKISFKTDAEVACSGDIRTLIDFDNYEAVNTSGATFPNLFEGCTQLKSAKDLVLQSTGLAANCYRQMFKDCSSLVNAPELPAETLAENCYSQMFIGCTSLTTAPELPATTLAESCYSSMFYGCSSLQTAPERLPATTLAQGCYWSMFNGCIKLVEAPELPAETLATNCYRLMFNGCSSLVNAPVLLPAETLAQSCYENMFKGCSSLVTAPELPAETLAQSCYFGMFDGCIKLEIAPELPAETLAEYCYSEMFIGCTSLKEITMLATDISATDCLKDWVNGVPATGGTFTMNASASFTPSTIGIPAFWTVLP